MIVNALAAVQRSGGGSPEYTLQRKFMEHYKTTERSSTVVLYQSIAAREFKGDT